jgi:hypothetical protein
VRLWPDLELRARMVARRDAINGFTRIAKIIGLGFEPIEYRGELARDDEAERQRMS